MAAVFHKFKVSSERKTQIIEEIGLGSEPRGSFYALLLTASMIASFGLMADSTAVVIGAMLVSPLMTPIQGISLALVRGDGRLLGHAVRSEVVGALLAICVPAVFGMLPINVEATPEMLARTQPNLLDLLVAVLAGFAGAYAMIDERISPALPGVAIATAIVPPLANCGLCLGLGAYAGALGSFLLFFANVLSILLITALVFMVAGLAPRWKWASPWDFARRFGPTTLGFILVGAFLTQALIGIVRIRGVNHNIRVVLDEELKNYTLTSLDRFISTIRKDSVEVLAMIRSSRIASPDQVKTIQTALSKKLGQEVQLVVRNTLAKDVSATGGTGQVMNETLDGTFMSSKTGDRQRILKNAEQILWELLAARPDFQLESVDYGQLQRGRAIFATLNGLRPPTIEEIRKTERLLQERLKDDQLNLIIRFVPSILMDRHGHALYGWTHYGEDTPEQQQLFEKIRNAIQEIFKTDYYNLHPVGIHFNALQKPLAVLIEAAGRTEAAQEERSVIEKKIAEAVQQPVQVSLWLKPEVVQTPSGEATIQSLERSGWSEDEAKIIKEWPNIK